MKILHITATHLTAFGGIPSVLRSLIFEQNKIKNVESRLLSINAKPEKKDIYFDYSDDIEQYILNYKPDITIIHSFYHTEYIKIAKILNKNNFNYFIEPHGSFVKKSFKKSFFKKKIANLTIFRKIIKNAKGYIYLSNEEQKSSIYHTKNDIIISNGIETNKFEVEKKNTVNFYYIGRYDIKEKGIDIILDALGKLDKENIKINFDFYGTGTKRSINYINNRIKKMKNVKVKNKGPIYGIEKLKQISSYNIMILISKHEGFPLTVLEALNNGTPCIVTKETNVINILKKHNTGWITKLNSNLLAETIKQSIKDYSKDRIGYYKRCKKTIEEEYRWNIIAEKSIKELKKIKE